jgi:predicted aspartyl protease
MSRRHLTVLAALTPVISAVWSAVWLISLSAQVNPAANIRSLLIKDDVQQAEAVLLRSPRSAETLAFQGEVDFRKGNFEKARTSYQAAIQMNEKTARAHFGLGKLALAKVNSKTALNEFRRAIALDPTEPLYQFYASEAADLEKNTAESKKHLEEFVRLDRHDDEDRLTEAKAGLVLMAAFGNKEYAVVKAPDQPAAIPLRKALNLIFADVKINGKGPYNFVVDTGASQTALSEKLAKDLGLKVITSTVLHGVGGTGKANSNIYRIDQLQIGEVSVGDLPVGTFDDPVISQLADGIIGTSMLADFIVTINYPDGRMELTHKPVSTPDAIPVWCVSNMLLLPADANGKPGNFIVDTGAITSVLSLGMANAMGINEKTPGALVDLGIAGVGGAQGITLMLPPVTLKTTRQAEPLSQALAIDLKEVSKMLGTEISGVAGFDFLSKYKLTIDYYKAEIHLMN